jgi:hypothetical protein
MLRGSQVISKLPLFLLLIHRTIQGFLQKQAKLRKAIRTYSKLIAFLRYHPIFIISFYIADKPIMIGNF